MYPSVCKNDLSANKPSLLGIPTAKSRKHSNLVI